MHDDEEVRWPSTFATVRIFGLHPDLVTEALDLVPTHVRVRGEPWRTRSGHASSVPSRLNGWFLSTRGIIHSESERRHIECLLDQLNGKEIALQRLRKRGSRMDLSCYWVAPRCDGPSVSPAMMRRLAALGLEVWLDVHFRDDGQQEPSPPLSPYAPRRHWWEPDAPPAWYEKERRAGKDVTPFEFVACVTCGFRAAKLKGELLSGVMGETVPPCDPDGGNVPPGSAASGGDEATPAP